MSEKWKKILKLGIALTVIIALSVACFFILKALGVTNIDTLQSLIERCGVWGKLVFLLLQVTVTSLLSFVPGTSMLFVTLGVTCFGANVETFLLLFSGVFLASALMDAIGRFGGSKLIVKLIGQDSYDEALNLVQTKGAVYVPVMYLLPVFPDDAICMISGALKVKWWVHYLEILLCRGIGCATIVFGVNLLPEELMSALKALDFNYIGGHIFDYLTMITVLAFWVILIFKSARLVDKKVEQIKMKRRVKKDEETTENETQREEESNKGV